jgi:hypothetical protein
MSTMTGAQMRPPRLNTTDIVMQIIQTRNNALAATDWTQMPNGTIPDAPILTDAQKAAYVTYRQQLRDLPPKIDIAKLPDYWPLLLGPAWPKRP